MLVEMKVSSLTTDPATDMPVLVLKDLEGRRVLPVWIGLLEAGSLALYLEHVELARPTTHDLILRLLSTLSATVLQAEITGLEEQAFLARVRIRRGELTIDLDARPSDAIALALRAGRPVLVEEGLLDRFPVIDLRDESGPRCGEPRRLDAGYLAGLADDEFGKWTM